MTDPSDVMSQSDDSDNGIDVARPFPEPKSTENSASGHPGGHEDIPSSACESCRRRKLKCSREIPGCSQCIRLGSTCLYDRRSKPGMKSGAIERLNKRLEKLEKILLDSEGKEKSPPEAKQQDDCLYHASLLLAKELQPESGLLGQVLRGNHHALQEIRRCGEPVSVNTCSSQSAPNEYSSRKRKRTVEPGESAEVFITDNSTRSTLPSDEVLRATVDAFFSSTHHWVPFLHPFRFMKDMQDPQQRPKLDIVLHAIVYSSMHRIDSEEFEIALPDIKRQASLSRDTVMLNALDSLTIEHVQALILVAFTDIVNGQVFKAWSIIGSLTRTVEYLQLTVEPDALQHNSLSTPLSLLGTPLDWTESETRRRVFWNIFLLDRFCSITTGWSTSLTSDDVHRRLPCDGELWHKESPACTPYFGIWNKAAAKIGNSVAYIPAHYPSSEHEPDPRSPTSTSSTGLVDTSKLGAFAYCIEATESLSQVTSFFLRQKVNFRDASEFNNWLTRFKELDLRLVHWKMFLPQKWKDSNVSRNTALISMDPNLTLAHITHNTSMVLLHQHIAYPPRDWNDFIKLPSSCSADTCQSAAIETASIGQKYLKHTGVGILSSQFALCTFVAARILLVHWRFYNTSLLPEYFVLLENLKRMSTLCRGAADFSEEGESVQLSDLDMAGKYAVQLEHLHNECLRFPHFRLDPDFGGLLPPLALPSALSASSPSPQHQLTNQNYLRRPSQASQSPRELDHLAHMSSANNISGVAQSPTSAKSFRTYSQPRRSVDSSPTWYSHLNNDRSSTQLLHHDGNMHNNNDTAELLAVSNQLMDHEFTGLDRVITLEDMDFALGLDLWNYSTSA